MGFSRQEYWGGCYLLLQGILDPGIKPVSLTSPALAGPFFTTSATCKALIGLGSALIQYGIILTWFRLPRWCHGKESAYQCRKCRRLGLIPGSGRSFGEGNSNPFQYFCLENPMDRGAWWATVHVVTKNWMQLSTHNLIMSEKTLISNKIALMHIGV